MDDDLYLLAAEGDRSVAAELPPLPLLAGLGLNFVADQHHQMGPFTDPSSLVLLMQRMELIDPLELRSADGGVGLEGH